MVDGSGEKTTVVTKNQEHDDIDTRSSICTRSNSNRNSILSAIALCIALRPHFLIKGAMSAVGIA